MKENTKKGVSRREFLGLSALGLASLTILPSWAIDGVRIAPSDRVVLGFIGLGQQALSDFKGFAACPGVQVAACCDVDTMKTERFRRRVAEWQASKGMNQRCDQYEFYEDLLERKDIDAIEVATPDHWHALATIHSCQSGKDVYCQKPLAYTIAEGLAMVKAVRNNKRVLQVGSQQRSSREFQAAIDMVQNGAIGHIEKIYARVGEPPTPLSLPEMPVPANLNFNQCRNGRCSGGITIMQTVYYRYCCRTCNWNRNYDRMPQNVQGQKISDKRGSCDRNGSCSCCLREYDLF